MFCRVHDSTSNDSVSMMVLPKPAIFMTARIMTESQHVNVHNYYTKQDNNKIQHLIEEVPSLLKCDYL